MSRLPALLIMPVLWVLVLLAVPVCLVAFAGEWVAIKFRSKSNG
jgi:uncharacterized membrane protein